MDDLLKDLATPLAIRDAGIVRLVIFNRPEKRNALSAEMRRGFAHALAEADADDRIAAIVITGAGGMFSAGLDISELREIDKLPPVRPHPGEAARTATKPLIAAVDGACITGGLEIALNCSFIIASDRARFADTHARAGGFPSWGLSALLPRAVGIRRARQMALTCASIDAATALSWGLINEVTTPEGLLPRAIEIAHATSNYDRKQLQRQFLLMEQNENLALPAALAHESKESARWIAGMAAKRRDN